TSVVEACAAGRQAVGVDINSLSLFVSQVKTTVLSLEDLNEVEAWLELLLQEMNLRRATVRDTSWIKLGYQRNINTRKTWPIRKLLEISLPVLELLTTLEQQKFARCVLLKTAQW